MTFSKFWSIDESFRSVILFVLCLSSSAQSSLEKSAETIFIFGDPAAGLVTAVQIKSPQHVRSRVSAYGWVEELRWSPDRNWVLVRTHTADQTIQDTDAEDYSPLTLYYFDQTRLILRSPAASENYPAYWKRAQKLRMRAFDWSSDGRKIFAVTPKGEIREYDLEEGKSRRLHPALTYAHSIEAVSVSPDGKTIAFVAADPRRGNNPDWDHRFSPTLHLLSVQTGKEKTLGAGSHPRWSSDGKRILCQVGSGKEIREYRLESGGFTTLVRAELQNYPFALYSQSGKEVYFLDMKASPGESSLQRGVYALDLQTRKRTLLVGADKISFTSKEYWADSQ